MGNAFSFPHGEELPAPPPPPGAMLIQDREDGALGIAKIRTFLSDTPETIAAKERLKASLGGCCPPWGHTYYRDGNTLTFNTIPTHTFKVCFGTCTHTFKDEEVGIDQLLKDLWPDAWLAIQPVLAQVNELTTDAWYGFRACCSNTVIKYKGASDVHQLLTASGWIIKLNEVLNPHGLAADLCEKLTVHELPSEPGEGPPKTWTEIDLYLRLFLWSARAAQAAPQPIQVDVPPGQTIAAGGHSIAVMGPDGQQCQTIVPPGLMPAQFFVFHVPARAATAPPPQTMQVTVPSGAVPGQMIAALAPDGKQYTMAVPEDGVGLGQSFQFNLPRDAAWWRTVEPPQAAPAHQVMVRPVFALYSQPHLSQWSVGYA